ncbi:MAG: UDP-N-acetylmuramoyl-tripeptide--D-alanyl-D-alanine ligase [Myxococcota bacterium]|nr:UDP-N-acetylmuramoyl-tripeptide--D-alanyl-D-alanine ligase [Myxococcota bacterium]
MSVAFTAADALDWTAGRLAAGSAEDRFEGVGIDTRTIEPGQLFVAIKGERHDAHGFIEAAVEAGATGLLVEDSWLASNSPPPDTCTLAVPDSTTALGALARGHRNRFEGPVVAVTGSNGKTTTKELIHSILSVSGPCLRNPGNLNNEFGLPLSLLARRDEDETAVVELGMNHRGEIARLAAIARPDVGVITNIGSAHIEFLGSQEAIAEEKGDLVASLGADGVAVLNHDDPLAMSQARRIGGALRTFGRGPGADVGAESVRPQGDGHYSFNLVAPEGRAQVRVRGLADTTVINALAAAAAALVAGADLESTARGLELFEGIKGRMAKRTTREGANLVDDTYNANPQSMQSALECLVDLKAKGRGIAILGDMGELGDTSEQAHRQLGRLSAQLGVDELFVLGENAQWIAEEALASGMAPGAVHVEKEHEAIGQSVQQLAGPGDWILVKGSRAMKMERLVEILASEEKN